MPLPRRAASFPIDQEFLNGCAPPKQVVDRYTLFGQYYEGEQKTLMTDRTRRYLQRSGLLFSENFCEPVVDVMAERLVVTGFAIEDKTEGASSAAESDDQDELGKWLDGVAQRNRLDAKQRNLHTTALVKGDGYLVVDFDNKKRIPRFTFNRPELIKPCYSPDEPDLLEYVSKRWMSKAEGPQNPLGRPIIRLNVYYPDRLEKYFKVSAEGSDGTGGSWEVWSDAGEGWPVPWVDSAGAPLGIPIFHFRHKALGGVHGRSELRSVVPQQDELNKQIIDLNDILDYQAFPLRWVSGVSDADDLRPEPGAMVKLTGSDAKAGQFDAADLGQVVAAVDATISRLARRSRTPLHLLTGGTTPSGEALKTAEAGLVAKVEASQVDFGQAWEDVALMALRLGLMQGVLPKAPSLDELVAQATWSSAQTRDELSEAQRATLLKDLGVSQRTLLTELGYDPDQEEENRAAEEAALNEAAGGLLDRGNASDYQKAPAVSVPSIHINMPKTSGKTITMPDGRKASVTENYG